MSSHCSLLSAVNVLTRQDFSQLVPYFTREIQAIIPTATKIIFLDHTSKLDKLPHLPEPSALRRYLRSNPTQPASYGPYLALPFPVFGEQPIVALVGEFDPLLLKKYNQDWLQETLNSLHNYFLTCKQVNTDLLTGLYNGVHLDALLHALPEGEHAGLMLVEIYPQARTAMDAMQHTRHAAAILRSFIGDRTPLHHLGHCIFAFICHECNDESISHLGPKLMSFLKQEGFKRAHAGYSQETLSVHPEQSQKILDEAWHALQAAGKRGPYSFCTFRSLQKSQQHTLYASNRHIQTRLRPYWKDLKQFALVQLGDSPQIFDLFNRLTQLPPACRKLQGPNREIFLLIPNINKSQATTFVRKILQPIHSGLTNKQKISAGIALYPFKDSKKSETVVHCRKALLHASLLGPGHITIFDALSLNVSGDFYYGEGDILRAVREYKHGLLIKPNDVNLLNSLGVSYAMMNRHRMAGDCFTKALSLKGNDFMAWYNMGLGYTSQNNIPKAIQAFEQALLCQVEEEHDAINARKDLPLHLGKLYFLSRDYQNVVKTLLPLAGRHSKTPLPGSVLRYFGEACYHIGNTQEAKIWLQRAIRFNEFDAEALSLLGEIYLASNEGDQIALKLCEKSIELNPAPPLFYLRLARAQIRCGMIDSAPENLQLCLSNSTTRPEALFLMGQLLLQQGMTQKARPWLTKAVATAMSTSPWLQKAQDNLLNLHLPQFKEQHANP